MSSAPYPDGSPTNRAIYLEDEAAAWKPTVALEDLGVDFTGGAMFSTSKPSPDSAAQVALHTPTPDVEVWAPEYHADGTADAWVRRSNDYARATVKNPLTESRWTNVAPVVNGWNTWTHITWGYEWKPPPPKSWHARAWRRARSWASDRLHALAYWVDPW